MALVGSLIATQASDPHQDTASAIALHDLWATTDGSMVAAIGAAIWTQRLPLALDTFSGSALNSIEIAEIYGSVVVARIIEPRDLVIAGRCILHHVQLLADPL